MFQIKICGITRAPDAIAAADAGADAIGLNFYSRSPRFTSVYEVQQSIAAVPDAVLKVGVFVNSTVEEILAKVEVAGIRWVQLHGNEPTKMLAELPADLSIVSAYRCDALGLAPLAQYIGACRAAGRGPDAVLIDAAAEVVGEFGGTGRVANWDMIAQDRSLLGELPLVLAGGLTPDNVAEAIKRVRPNGVDVASGVESRPGEKDPKLIERFVASARDAFLRYT